MPIGLVNSMSTQIYQVNAKFRIEVGAKLGVGVEVPMENYVKSLASTTKMLSIKIMTDVTAVVSKGSSSSGSQVLIKGEAGPLKVVLADVISLLALGAAGAFRQELTFYGATRIGSIDMTVSSTCGCSMRRLPGWATS